MKCMDCGMDGLFAWQIHYPDNDPENGPAHAPAAYRRCWHCAEPARTDSEFCQNHYVLTTNTARERLLCEPCRFALKYPKSGFHELCEGCQCQQGSCDPYKWNEEIDYNRSQQ